MIHHGQKRNTYLLDNQRNKILKKVAEMFIATTS